MIEKKVAERLAEDGVELEAAGVLHQPADQGL